MKILLLGEYSNVHHTLALGLRSLGHQVTVASDGDGWKNYPRDVDLQRRSIGGWGSLRFLAKLCREFVHFRGYDVVQLINPVFIELKAERIMPFYRYLRRHNRHVVMGAFGMDYYYVKACLDFKTFRYSDFNFGNSERLSDENAQFKRDWLYGAKARLNQEVAHDCDAIVTGLYEYDAAYRAQFDQVDKLQYIPFPIIPHRIADNLQFERPNGAPLQLFIGIQKSRSAYKGTDIMLRAAQRVVCEFPDAVRLFIAQNMPFENYVAKMNSSEVILDQLYSYTPAMNALEGMARGLINVGGAEPENYAILNEEVLRPIINVEPNEESVYQALRQLVLERDMLVPKLQNESRAYILKHHDYIKVAQCYEALYRQLDQNA